MFAAASDRGSFAINASEAVRGLEGHLADTFVSVRGWGKGLIWVNGFNLGWYWPSIGPQEAHYIPGPLLRDGDNEIIMLEVEATPSDATGASSAPSCGPVSSDRPLHAWTLADQHCDGRKHV